MVDESHEEEFTSRKLLRRKAVSSRAIVVRDGDCLAASIFENKVDVLGSEVSHFVQCYEQKLGQYLNKPFLRLLTDGSLLRDLSNFKKYVLGTAICKHYGFPPKRFIEVQFHFHDEWKGDAPTVHYVTSLHSEWNSVGRYKDYCERFKTELDYFGKGQDNLNISYRVQRTICKPTTINTSLVAVYEDMIQFQEAAKGIGRKSALKILGHPGKERVPFRYLKTLPMYMELVEEDAWGDTVKSIDHYRKLKIEIENLRYAG